MRKDYLDNIRWVTIVLVVIYHVLYMFNSVITDGVVGPLKYGATQPQDGIMYMLYPWFMVILFVVAGASSRYSLEKMTTKEFIKSRTNKLLVPSTIGLLAFQWIQGYYNMAIANAFSSMGASVPKVVLFFIMCLSGTGVLWFIQMLWLFSILLVLVRKIDKEDGFYNYCGNARILHLLLLTIPVVLSAKILNTPVVCVYRFGIYTFVFFVGYFVFSHEEVIQRLSKHWIWLSLLSINLGLAYTIIYFGENYATTPGVSRILAVTYGWITVLAVFALFRRFFNKKNEFAKYMTAKCWGIYIFHYLPISIEGYYLSRTSLENVWVAYLLCLVTAFAGSFVLYEIISKIPFFRWAVLGITKK